MPAANSFNLAIGRQSIESGYRAATELHAREPFDTGHNAFNANHHFRRWRYVARE